MNIILKFYRAIVEEEGPVYLMEDDLIVQGFSQQAAKLLIQEMAKIDLEWEARK